MLCAVRRNSSTLRLPSERLSLLLWPEPIPWSMDMIRRILLNQAKPELRQAQFRHFLRLLNRCAVYAHLPCRFGFSFTCFCSHCFSQGRQISSVEPSLNVHDLIRSLVC